MSSITLDGNRKVEQELRRHPIAVQRSPGVERALLCATTATAIIAAIPPLRVGGAIALRSIALLSSIALGTQNPSIPTALKVIVVGLGLLAVIAASPALIAASLAMDICIQLVATCKAMINKQWDKALIHTGMFVIDSLTLGAIITASWQLMVIATWISVATMTGAACKAGVEASLSNNDAPGKVIDAICYGLLTALGIGTCISIMPHHGSKPVSAHFSLKNHSDKFPMIAKDKKSDIVSTVKPGETAEFTLPHENTICGTKTVHITSPSYHYYSHQNHYHSHISHVTIKTLNVLVESQGAAIPGWLESADRIQTVRTLIRPALDPKLFLTVPISGTAIVSKDL